MTTTPLKLHRIEFSHHSPKDSEKGTKTYVLWDNDEAALRDRIDQTYAVGAWKEEAEEATEPYEIYDDQYNVIGSETYLERMLRLRGDIRDEDKDFADADYGITCWGWDEGQVITEELGAELVRLGIAQDWRGATQNG